MYACECFVATQAEFFIIFVNRHLLVLYSIKHYFRWKVTCSSLTLTKWRLAKITHQVESTYRAVGQHNEAKNAKRYQL